jgi:hypothetical protein
MAFFIATMVKTSNLKNLSGIVHFKLIPKRMTVNNRHYKEVHYHLHSQFILSVVTFGAVSTGCCYTKVLLHVTMLFGKELAIQLGTVLLRPAYSRDHSPCNLFFISCLKETLNGHQFQSAEKDCHKGSKHI